MWLKSISSLFFLFCVCVCVRPCSCDIDFNNSFSQLCSGRASQVRVKKGRVCLFDLLSSVPLRSVRHSQRSLLFASGVSRRDRSKHGTYMKKPTWCTKRVHVWCLRIVQLGSEVLLHLVLIFFRNAVPRFLLLSYRLIYVFFVFFLPSNNSIVATTTWFENIPGIFLIFLLKYSTFSFDVELCEINF